MAPASRGRIASKRPTAAGDRVLPGASLSGDPVAMKGLYLLTLGLALAAAGCGGSASSLCNDLCDCTGCSDNELDDCVDDVEDQIKEAEDEGCSDQADAYIDCLSSEFECRDSEVDVDGCDSESEELGKCLR
jgi:hypothetical protein